MPELPEVETIVRDLRPRLVGRSVTAVVVRWKNSVRTPVDALKRELPGQKILALERRGKYLKFVMSGGDLLFLHLKMSGDLLVEPRESDTPHVRTVFALDDGSELRFKDPRKFGRVYLVKDESAVTGSLGPEPLDDGFKLADFVDLFQKRKGKLKPLLLNQQFIAGLGNIYVDESCFRAGVNPMRQASSLTTDELRRMYLSIRAILSSAIKHHGSTFDWVYRGGGYQSRLKVYGRADEPCVKCGGLIKRVTVAARSTHFCPRCQVLKRARRRNK